MPFWEEQCTVDKTFTETSLRPSIDNQQLTSFVVVDGELLFRQKFTTLHRSFITNQCGMKSKNKTNVF